MPVIDLQRRLQECGRIRIGQQVPSGKGTRPARLETFRLTSPDRARIENAARLYGGKVQAWQAPAGSQWEVITQADRLPVIVPPASMAFSQWLELWSGGGCLRRCTGSPIAIDAEQLTDGPCICEAEGTRQCEYHTRLSLLLRDMTGLGLWRLDSQGYYAAIELAGAVDIISQAAGAGMMLPAVLRLEQRVQKRPGEPTRRFAVPVLDIQATPAQLLGGGSNGHAALEPPMIQHRRVEEVLSEETPPEVEPEPEPRYRGNVKPIAEDSPVHWPVGSLAQQAGLQPPPEGAPAPKAKARRRKADPIPATGIEPRTREQADADTRGTPPPSADQPRGTTRAPKGKAGPRPRARASSDLSGPAAGAPVEGALPAETNEQLADRLYGPRPEQAEETVTVSAHLGDAPPPITDEQVTKLSILLNEAGLGDHDSALAWINEFLHTRLESRKQLSKPQAIELIDVLERDAENNR